jgi:hypothetical protein
MWTAVGVVVVLVGILVLLLSSSKPQPPATSSASNGPVGSQTAPTPTSVPPVAPDAATLIAATQQALHAWAAFATTGDLRVVQPCFWPDGPQYHEFQREAAQRGGMAPDGPSYSYQLSGLSVQAAAAQPTVRGTVTVRRPGSRPASFTWEFFLRYDQASRRWRVWMVIPTAATTSSLARSG